MRPSANTGALPPPPHTASRTLHACCSCSTTPLSSLHSSLIMQSCAGFAVAIFLQVLRTAPGQQRCGRSGSVSPHPQHPVPLPTAAHEHTGLLHTQCTHTGVRAARGYAYGATTTVAVVDDEELCMCVCVCVGGMGVGWGGGWEGHHRCVHAITNRAPHVRLGGVCGGCAGTHHPCLHSPPWSSTSSLACAA